jgi:hypothetical protein
MIWYRRNRSAGFGEIFSINHNLVLTNPKADFIHVAKPDMSKNFNLDTKAANSNHGIKDFIK